MNRPVVLLGPQRLRPTVAGVVRALGIDGPVAVVTAGWQERESEIAELAEHLALPVVNLDLYRRTEEVFAADTALFDAHRDLQDRFRRAQEVYRLRLAHALEAVRELVRRAAEGNAAAAQEVAAGIDEVRRLDGHHLERLRAARHEFERAVRPRERPALAAQRAELAARLAGTAAVAVAGGHVAVLLNRLRLFGLLELAGERPALAWSAGAMALAERVVLFHDHPPQGPGNAEVLDAGLGIARGVVPLPHARRRLDLADSARVSLFARRFAPLAALALDDGAILPLAGAGSLPVEGVSRLMASGSVAPLGGEGAGEEGGGTGQGGGGGGRPAAAPGGEEGG